jgi:hypothetical protein
MGERRDTYYSSSTIMRTGPDIRRRFKLNVVLESIFFISTAISVQFFSFFSLNSTFSASKSHSNHTIQHLQQPHPTNLDTTINNLQQNPVKFRSQSFQSKLPASTPIFSPSSSTSLSGSPSFFHLLLLFYVIISLISIRKIHLNFFSDSQLFLPQILFPTSFS